MLRDTLLDFKSRLLQFVQWIQGYPRLLALFGFISGILSFFLVDRQARTAGIFAILMLVSWGWLLLENLLHGWLRNRFGWDLPIAVIRYLTQTVHQESLFFSLPFLVMATDWYSPQLLFTLLIAGMALTSIIEPLYKKRLQTRPWLYLSFHSITLFVLMLTVLPILLHLTTLHSYLLALGITTLFSVFSLTSALDLRTRRHRMLLVGFTCLLAVIGWYGRIWVPPATLRLTQMTLSAERHGRDPGPRVEHLDARALQRGLYAFSAISAPRGLKEPIYHQWLHEGQVIDQIALDIQGGSTTGYRAWSHKTAFPLPLQGTWEVRVVTAGGQRLGSRSFQVD